MKNAIILAAGKSNRFAPFTYERPKGLFRIKGEILIERQIRQLQEAGINEIYVVVGYMKEKFFYLESKYNVHLISNSEFGQKGNLYSLFLARKHLDNSYICYADHYFPQNPFLNDNSQNYSYRAIAKQVGIFRQFGVTVSDADVITSVTVGGHDGLAMVGQAYFNSGFSHRFRELMEDEINDFGVSSMFLEEFYARHIEELTMFAKMYDTEDVIEFDGIDDLDRFDSEFLDNVDSEIINNICEVLKIYPKQIKNIAVINAGLTNVSFTFDAGMTKYVYRHPGGAAGNLIDRQAELVAQTTAKNRGIDDSAIYMDLSGWKISRYIEGANYCDFESSKDQLETGMNYLHRIHDTTIDGDVKVFDDFEEAMKLISLASSTKGNLSDEFAEIIEKVGKLYSLIKKDAKRLGYGLVLCHNDVYIPNYLRDKNGQVYLIDWEYAGLNYAANDLGGILSRYDWTNEQITRYLRAYFGRELTVDENRFYKAFIPISAFYWFAWGLYKGSVGDDDGFFFLSAYRNLVKYIDQALKSYLE